jgi:hypothetical protein
MSEYLWETKWEAHKGEVALANLKYVSSYIPVRNKDY